MYRRTLQYAWIVLLGIGVGASAGRAQETAPEAGPDEATAAEAPQAGQAGTPAVPQVALGPELPTVPVRREVPGPNVRLVDASVLPRDPQGIWVLDFAFKPVRMQTVEIPGKGRRPVHYLWYRIINRTGQPRLFVPQFTLVTDTGKRYEDVVIPQAVELIRNREDPSTPLRDTVSMVGYVPTSGQKEGIDDAIFGVATWEGVDPEADNFSIYVRGLSDGWQQVPTPDGGEPITRYKTLRIDFSRPGDERNANEREIRLLDPPYEWIYW